MEILERPSHLSVKKSEHEAPFIQFAFNRPDGGLPDHITKLGELLMHRRENVSALRFKRRQVCLPAHKVKVRKGDGEFLLVAALASRTLVGFTHLPLEQPPQMALSASQLKPR